MAGAKVLSAVRLGGTMGYKMFHRDIIYKFKAISLGVKFIGIHEKRRIVLFQDPVTGSSFATKQGESVESGIKRVRERFGLFYG